MDSLIKQGELIKGHTHSVDTNDTWTGHTQPGFSGSNTTLTSYGSTYDTSKTLTGVIASGIPNRADVTSGCFSKTKDGYHEYDGGDWGGSQVSWDGTHSHNVKVSVNYTPSGSIDYHNHYIPPLSGTAYANDNIETRPSNFTIRVWKRIS